MSRIDRLENIAKECLRVGSVIGLEFPVGILNKIINKNLGLSLDLTEREGLTYRVVMKEVEYMFRHAILKDVVYDSILHDRQKKLHQSVAETIEIFYRPGLERFFKELAYHFTRAEKTDKALEYNIKAGDAAAYQYREEDALLHYETAIRILKKKKGRDALLSDIYEKAGAVYNRTGNSKTAEEYFINMTKVIPSNQKVKASSYFQRACVAEHTGDYSKAKEFINKSVDIWKRIKKDTPANKSYAITLSWGALIYSHIGELDRALQMIESGEKIITKAKTKDNVLRREVKMVYNTLLNHKASIYYRKTEIQRAADMFEKIAKLELDIENYSGVAVATGNLGAMYYELGDYNTANKYQRESLEMNTKIGHKRGAATSLFNLAISYFTLGDYDGGVQYLKDTLTLTAEIGDRNLESKAINSMAEYYYSKKNFKKALEYLKKGLSLAEEIGNLHELSASYCTIGSFFQMRNKNSEAVKYQKRGLEFAKKANNIRMEALALRNIGIIYSRQKNRWKEALQALMKAKCIFDQNAIKYHSCITADAIAELMLMRKDYKAAERYALETLNLSKELGVRDAELNAYRYLGKICFETGFKEKALEHFSKGLEIVKLVNQPNAVAKFKKEYDKYSKRKDRQ